MSTDQVAAAVHGFFWPKIFWDFATKTLDLAVKPYPILQTINLIMGLWMLAWEWPLSFIAGSTIHRSMEARLAFLPLTALAAILTYQGTNAALYYLAAMAVEFWAYAEGEVCREPHRALYGASKLTRFTDHLCQTMDATTTRDSVTASLGDINTKFCFGKLEEFRHHATMLGTIYWTTSITVIQPTT